MSSHSVVELQKKSLDEMEGRSVHLKTLAGLQYEVFPRVYKGSTDTELMCEVLGNKVEGKNVWEIGTGTGLVALVAKKCKAKYVLATDLNPDAVKNTKRNSELLNLEIDVEQYDLFGNVSKRFDVIVFNPPYTNHSRSSVRKFEMSFWDPGHKTTEKFIKSAKKYLNVSGKIFIGWASFAKVSVLKQICEKQNFNIREIKRKRGKRGFVYYVFELIA